MILNLTRARQRLGPEQAFTLKAMAEGHGESVHFEGWRIGAAKWSDPPGARVIVPAITAVAIYLTVDGDLLGVLDQYPQPDQPEWERFAYKDLPMWMETGATTEDLRSHLYERATWGGAQDRARIAATDLAIAEAQRRLATLNEEEK